MLQGQNLFSLNEKYFYLVTSQKNFCNQVTLKDSQIYRPFERVPQNSSWKKKQLYTSSKVVFATAKGKKDQLFLIIAFQKYICFYFFKKNDVHIISIILDCI